MICMNECIMVCIFPELRPYECHFLGGDVLLHLCIFLLRFFLIFLFWVVTSYLSELVFYLFIYLFFGVGILLVN